jgi:hypothetical protein
MTGKRFIGLSASPQPSFAEATEGRPSPLGRGGKTFPRPEGRGRRSSGEAKSQWCLHESWKNSVGCLKRFAGLIKSLGTNRGLTPWCLGRTAVRPYTSSLTRLLASSLFFLLVTALPQTARAGPRTLQSDLAVSSVTVQSGATLETNGWNITVDSDVVVLGSGTIDAAHTGAGNAGKASLLTLSGNWSMMNSSGVFVAADSTVTFAGLAGSTSTLTGHTTFYTLKDITPGHTLAFPAASTTVVSGALILNGASGLPIYVRSSADGSYAYLFNSGTNSVTFANPKDSYSSSQTIVDIGGTDQTHNYNWSFLTGGAIWTSGGDADHYGTTGMTNGSWASLQSDAQTFVVGASSVAAATMTITQVYVVAGTSGAVTAAKDIRIKIPAGLAMSWDTTVLTAVIGGGAAAKVSGTVSYENSGKTLVLNVTSDFAAGDSITISGVAFQTFTAAGVAALQTDVDNGAVTDVDMNAKTIQNADAAFYEGGDADHYGTTGMTNGSWASLQSDAQTFVVGGSSVAAATMTITQVYVVAGTSGAVTAAKDIRIRIPAGLAMNWDTSALSAVIGGGAAAKVSGTVSYEDAGKTLVLNVSSDFVAGDSITVSGVAFTTFTGVSQGALQVDVDSGAVTGADVNVKTIGFFDAASYAGGDADHYALVALYNVGVASITAVSSYSITAAWSNADSDLGYILEASTGAWPNSYAGNKSSSTTNGALSTMTVSGLNSGTIYYLRVGSLWTDGTTSYALSAPVSTMTLSAVSCAARTSAASGAWSVGSTWDVGQAPVDCSSVTIRAGDAVTAAATVSISSLTVNGTLTLDSGGGAFTFTILNGGLAAATGSSFVQGAGNTLVVTGLVDLAVGSFTRDISTGTVTLKGTYGLNARGQNLGNVIFGH